MKIEDGSELPRELESIHEELSGIHIEERPSFGPELESELESENIALLSVGRRERRVRRAAVAAGTVAILGLASVPQARAALIRVLATVSSPEAESVPQPQASDTFQGFEPLAQFVPIEAAEEPAPEPAETPWTEPDLDEIRPTFAYPKLQDADEAERIIEMFYPARLQRRGIGGSVRVMLWVDEEGVVQDRQVLDTSGDRSLDGAALNATARLRFEPARRQGQPVGSWVKFNIQFRPPDQPGAIEPSISEDQSDGVETSVDRADTSGARPRS